MEEGMGEKRDNRATTKRGSSILLLFLIMTLLAMWIAVLKEWSNNGRSLQLELALITCHQLVFLTLVGALIWVVVGRRRIAIYGMLCLVIALWAPMTGMPFSTSAIIIAMRHVYATEGMEPVSVALSGKTEVDEVTLSEAYLESAGAVAKLQAAVAAVRLAKVWGR